MIILIPGKVIPDYIKEEDMPEQFDRQSPEELAVAKKEARQLFAVVSNKVLPIVTEVLANMDTNGHARFTIKHVDFYKPYKQSNTGRSVSVVIVMDTGVQGTYADSSAFASEVRESLAAALPEYFIGCGCFTLGSTSREEDFAAFVKDFTDKYCPGKTHHQIRTLDINVYIKK